MMVSIWKECSIQKNRDGTFIVSHMLPSGEVFPYQVCDKATDPIGAYDLGQVSQFWESLPKGDPRKVVEPEPPPMPILSLEEAKAIKKAIIDKNTNRIRDREGLSYGGERFAMTEGAVLKWTGLLAAKDILPYPVVILTMDDKPFSLASQGELLQFIGAVLSYETSPDSPLTTGRALRMRVEAAETVEDVEAVVDDRK